MTTGTMVLGGLYPPYADAIRIFLAYCDYYGLSVSLTSGYRSLQEQTALYSQGRTPAEVSSHVSKQGRGGTVTDAWPGASAHNYGLAVDVDSPQLAEVMSLARQLGFGTVSWDPDHLEWPRWRETFGISLS